MLIMALDSERLLLFGWANASSLTRASSSLGFDACARRRETLGEAGDWALTAFYAHLAFLFQYEPVM